MLKTWNATWHLSRRTLTVHLLRRPMGSLPSTTVIKSCDPLVNRCRIVSDARKTIGVMASSARFNSNKSANDAGRNILIQKQLSALRFKSRILKKRSMPGKDEWSVVGYSVADSIDLFSLYEGLEKQSIYAKMELSKELEGSCLYITNKYKLDLDSQIKEIFIFKEGSIIFWNVPELERNSVLKFLMKHCQDSYEDDVIYDESEMMSYVLSPTEISYLGSGIIHLNTEGESSLLSKYTFSNAIATSVKLGTWEATLENIIDSIDHIAEDLKQSGNVRLSRNEVLQKTGEILALRHLINLSSDLLDTPDFYWDREHLENIYLSTCGHLAVNKRTKTINEKLSHCLELMELISSHLNNEHSARLEWIIIILIAIEICFEMLHLIERKMGGFSFLDPKPD